MTPPSPLLGLLERPGPLVAPGVFDAVSARMAVDAGFEAVYVSGFAAAASLGLPDVGVTTMTEVGRQAGAIAAAVDVPVMCDVDTGFGDDRCLARTVRELERAGVAGIKFEDQLTPPNRQGRPLLAAEAMARKLAVAADARAHDGFVLMARTDAAPTQGTDEAIRRCRLYEQAGADATHALDVPTEEEMGRLVEAMTKPAIAVISLPHPPILTAAQFGALGFRLVVASVPLQFAATRAVADALDRIKGLASPVAS